MIRLMGALFIAAGSAWLGFGAAGRLGARTRTLEELAEGLSRMARELELDQPPLEQLLERLIPGSRGAARTLFAGWPGGAGPPGGGAFRRPGSGWWSRSPC